jgi:hypothetical protein
MFDHFYTLHVAEAINKAAAAWGLDCKRYEICK